MRILSIILFFLCFQLTATAQKVYFIYLQSDNGAPFFVKANDQIFSSVHPGYLILPNLVDSTYQFSIGFSSSRSESRFIVPLGARDRGFLIKEFDYGFGLFDLQTLSVIRPQVNEAKKTSYQYRNDDFTALLAKAANDTTLFYVPIFAKEDVAMNRKKVPDDKPEEKKTEPEKSISSNPGKEEQGAKNDIFTSRPVSDVAAGLPKSDTMTKVDLTSSSGVKARIDSPTHVISTVVKQTQDSVNLGLSSDKVKTEAPPVSEGYKRSEIKKLSESSTTEGFGLVYHDRHEGSTDTIRLLIPNPSVAFQQVDSVKKEETVQLPPPVID